jgi:hypothetical protein
MDNKNGTYVIVDETRTAGCVTYWECSGLTHRVKLNNALKEVGFPEKLLPSLPTLTAAIGKAATKIASSTIKTTKQNGKTYLCVKRQNDVNRPQFVPVVSVSVVMVARQDGSMVETAVVENLDNEAGESLANLMRVYIITAQESMDGAELGTYLADWAVSLLGGTSLRTRGGFYYIVPEGRFLLTAISAAVKSANTGGNVVYQIPCMPSEDAAKAILDAMSAEADEAAKAIADWLDEHSEDIQERSRVLRDGILTELKAKVSRYEELFGKPLKDTMDHIARVRSKLNGTFVKTDAAVEGRQATEGVGLLELDDKHTDTNPEETNVLDGVRQLEMD